MTRPHVLHRLLCIVVVVGVTGLVNQVVGGAVEDVYIDVARYPEPWREEDTVDVINNYTIPDPYRWMENKSSPETADFIDQLNDISIPFLEASGIRSAWIKEMNSMRQTANIVPPKKHGDHYYEQRNNIVYKQRSLKGKSEVFLDLRKWGRIEKISWSEDDTTLAVVLQKWGKTTIKFWKSTGEELPDVVTNIKKYQTVSFLGNKGVIYATWKGVSLPRYYSKFVKHAVFYHELGTSADSDIQLTSFGNDRVTHIIPTVTNDHRYLFITVQDVTTKNLYYYYDFGSGNGKVEENVPVKLLFSSYTGYNYIANYDENFLLKEAKAVKIIRINTNNLDSEIAAETFLETASNAQVCLADGNKLMFVYKWVETVYDVYDIKSGKLLSRLTAQMTGFQNLACSHKSAEVLVSSYTNFQAPVLYRLNLSYPETFQLEVVKVGGFDPDKYDAKIVFFPGKDGVKRPMFLSHKKGLALDGKNAVMMFGEIGIFRYSPRADMLPYSSLLFMEKMGGIIAFPHLRILRGYSETAQDDFIAAAEYLIREGYTSAAKLAIRGFRNDALLVTAVAQRRPELFGAVTVNVGILDMIRHVNYTDEHEYTPVKEGNYPKSFKAHLKFSPLHNIRVPRTHQQPATLLTAVLGNGVVKDASMVQTLKYVAELYHALRQTNVTQTNPVIARIRAEPVSHVHPTAADQAIRLTYEEEADIYAFVQRVFNRKIVVANAESSTSSGAWFLGSTDSQTTSRTDITDIATSAYEETKSSSEASADSTVASTTNVLNVNEPAVTVDSNVSSTTNLLKVNESAVTVDSNVSSTTNVLKDIESVVTVDSTVASTTNVLNVN